MVLLTYKVYTYDYRIFGSFKRLLLNIVTPTLDIKKKEPSLLKKEVKEVRGLGKLKIKRIERHGSSFVNVHNARAGSHIMHTALE